MKRRLTHFASGAIAASLLAGCTVGPNYKRPAMDMPAEWSGAPATRPSTQPTTQPAAFTRWWTVFNDPTLDSLIQRGVASNLDLQVAAARVREARAQRGVTAAGEWPQVDVSGSYRHTRSSANGGIAGARALGGTGSAASGVPGSLKRDQDLFQGGFDALWEADVFGGVRRGVETADANIAAAREGQRDVLVSLLAEVARNYIELRGFQQQVEIARRNIKAQRATLELTQSRFAAGLVSELDVTRSQAQVATTESQIPSLDISIQRSISRLGVLLGQPPETLLAELRLAAAIPVGASAVPMGLPSDLLRRRPDIRRAERLCAAASAQIGVATADLFPRFSLSGSVGLQSTALNSLTNLSGSGFWFGGPSVSWSIFNAGRIKSNIQVQIARDDQTITQYQQVVLLALEEVENALTAYNREQSRRVFLAEAVRANRRSKELADELYKRGLTDFLSVLEAERSLFATEDQLAQSDRAISTNLVALYKALGGGWE